MNQETKKDRRQKKVVMKAKKRINKAVRKREKSLSESIDPITNRLWYRNQWGWFMEDPNGKQKYSSSKLEES